MKFGWGHLIQNWSAARRNLALGLALTALTSGAALAADDGTVVGTVSNTASQPVAHATVTATRVDGKGIRATLSGSDGVYSFPDLPPGVWSIKSQAAGYVDAVQQVKVTGGAAARTDIVLNVPTGAPAPAALPPPPPATPIPQIADALQLPDPAPANDTQTPYANVDTTWMNGSGRNQTPVFDTKFFTPEIRFDMNYLIQSHNPKDHTISGSTEEFRSNEVQIEQVSFGGDFHWEGVHARFLSMFGDFATTTPRNDASAGVGAWDLQGAYKYMSEANAGYHWDNINHGLNIDAGIFVSYIGLFSYYNFDNWTYQPSFVSSNTPWFFNGIRIQWYPTQNLKIEPWIINGWQSYAMYNKFPGFGGQILWIPSDNFKLVLNSYSLGQDNLANNASYNATTGQLSGNYYGTTIDPCNYGTTDNGDMGVCHPAGVAYQGVNYAKVHRIHEDDSILWKYFDAKGSKSGPLPFGITRMALSLTWDVGCQYGGGESCFHGANKADFVGTMLYDRTWFGDHYALTIGGGVMNNPGRYLALTPPVNGATALTGTPYFSQNPGLKLIQADYQVNFQYMPKPWITWWVEGTYRYSDVPYWTGANGLTPPNNGLQGSNGSPGSLVCGDGTVDSGSCAADGGLWYPELVRTEAVFGAGVLVKF
jgi:hypothetical protein